MNHVQMDKKLVFRAICDMVADISSLYEPRKKRPLDYYARLIERIAKDDNEQEMDKCIQGFKAFFSAHGESLHSTQAMMNSIPRGTVIRYGTSKVIYLEIQMYLYQANASVKESIREHLLTIFAAIEPSEKALQALESTTKKPTMLDDFEDDDSAEGVFVRKIFTKVVDSLKDVDASNPAEVMSVLVTSGALGDIMKNMQNVEGMDLSRLLQKLQQAMTRMTSQMPDGGEQVREMQDALTTVFVPMVQQQETISEPVIEDVTDE